MKKNIIITGSTGMVGRLVLERCLQRQDVKNVTAIARRKSGIKHLKLTEAVHDDFFDYSSVIDHFKNQDVCFYCLGVYTGSVPRNEFRVITVDYIEAFSETLRNNSKKTSFCFLSGQGADSSERSRVMFARDKGAAENIVIRQNFENTYIFRPGYIYPSITRKEPNFGYRLMRLLYRPVLSKIYPNIGISSENLAEAMVEIGMHGGNDTIYDNKGIRKYLQK